ncbi:MAG: pyrroline-5-carboxylate reductase [Planctomycetes bacterium]|nr:pyrroline-5-carboxylate reductase [Planctomycetota bacterium]
MLKDKTLAVLGAGKLGETMIRALIEAGAVDRGRVIATARHPETVEARVKAYGIRGTTDNREAASNADVVLISVKPQQMAEALASIQGAVRHQLVVSTATGVTTDFIERGLGDSVPVVRTMPNTPCLLRAGMTAIAAGTHARREHVAVAEAVFGAMGRTRVVDERHMDAVTGLSGSGPAFMYVVLEALAEGGVKMGLPRETATELIAQTMLGAARMVLETREHPAKLKDIVTTPAGCTIDGLLELEEGGLRVALIKAVVKATQRAAQLGGRTP